MDVLCYGSLVLKQYCYLRVKIIPIIYNDTLPFKVLFVPNCHEKLKEKASEVVRLFPIIDEVFLSRYSQISAFPLSDVSLNGGLWHFCLRGKTESG